MHAGWEVTLLGGMALACLSNPAWATQPTRKELSRARHWVQENFKPLKAAETPTSKSPALPPFSFVYGGRASRELLGTWPLQEEIRTLDSSRVEHTWVYSDPKTGLSVRCVAMGGCGHGHESV